MRIPVTAVVFAAAIFAAVASSPALGQLMEPPAATTQPSATQPSSAPASAPASGPAATAPSVDPAAEKLLDLLDAAGKTHHTVTADLKYDLEELTFGDVETRFGKVYYQAPAANQSAMFRVHFDTLLHGGVKAKEEQDYAFTGTWLIQRLPKVKQQVEYAVPPQDRANAMRIGQGPFPVPFGQKKEDVLRLFNAATQPAKSGPEGTGYLLLTAKPGSEMDISRLEMWVILEGPLAGLPVKIISENNKSQQVTTVSFTNIQSNQPLARSVFELPPPPSDWEYRHKSLGEGENVNP